MRDFWRNKIKVIWLIKKTKGIEFSLLKNRHVISTYLSIKFKLNTIIEFNYNRKLVPNSLFKHALNLSSFNWYNTWAMCLAEMSSTMTNDACHPCFKPKISRRPSSTWASTKPFWKIKKNINDESFLGIREVSKHNFSQAWEQISIISKVMFGLG